MYKGKKFHPAPTNVTESSGTRRHTRDGHQIGAIVYPNRPLNNACSALQIVASNIKRQSRTMIGIQSKINSVLCYELYQLNRVSHFNPVGIALTTFSRRSLHRYESMMYLCEIKFRFDILLPIQ